MDGSSTPRSKIVKAQCLLTFTLAFRTCSVILKMEGLFFSLCALTCVVSLLEALLCFVIGASEGLDCVRSEKPTRQQRKPTQRYSTSLHLFTGR